MKWGDLISLEYGKPVQDKASTDGSIPVYGTNGKIGTSNLPPLCKIPSFILGRKGAYRGVHYSDSPFSVIDTAFYALPKRDNINMKWAYYKFMTYDINNMDSGSAIPSTNRYEIYNIDVLVPTMEYQNKIVSFMEILDYKIECNIKLNKNLEKQARAIFYKYFIYISDVPTNWQEANLTNIAEYRNGLAMQKFRPQKEEKSLPVLKIKELRQGHCDLNSERCSLCCGKLKL